ncbi:Malonyl CoA-acyl carrier protein transacylase [Buchnera aphidicola (Thelaxes suberi)]|uniref:acyltransferase domain-containing protein n=1 Tax=Buchnera aphidicola TaxID=9 RepID=UPI003464E258
MIIAMMFPGQGFYSPKSIYQLNLSFPIIKQTFIEASEYAGINLWNLIQNNVNKNFKINNPVMNLTISIAIYNLWKKIKGIIPTYMIGHSLGEYSALVCAQSISFADAIKIIIKRNELMLSSAKKKPEMMQAIIGLNKKKVLQACNKINNHNNVVSIASINSSKQIIISGNKSAVIQTVNLCQKYGSCNSIQLPIKIASHSILMYKAAKKFKMFIHDKKICTPICKVINPLTISCYLNSTDIKNALVKQLISNINWKNSIIYLQEKKKVSLFLEISSNCVLTQLNRSITTITTLPLNNYSFFIKAMNNIKIKKKLL